MNIQQLQAFLKITEYGNFTVAARHLSISQPALTKLIQSLEKDIGHTLIQRTTKKISITGEGEIVQRYARSILALCAAMENELSQNENTNDSLRLGYVTDSHTPFIENGIHKLTDVIPSLTIRINQFFPSVLIEKIRNNELDCALIHQPSIKNANDLSAKRILKCGVVAQIPKNDPLSAYKIITMKQLENRKILRQTVICPESSNFINNALKKTKTNIICIDAKTIEELQLLQKSLKAIRLTAKISPAPTDYVNIPIKELISGFDLFAIWNPKNKNPNIRRFIESIL